MVAPSATPAGLISASWTSAFKRVNELVLRLPTGALILSMQSLGGESVRERRRRERREQYELRLAEW